MGQNPMRAEMLSLEKKLEKFENYWLHDLEFRKMIIDCLAQPLSNDSNIKYISIWSMKEYKVLEKYSDIGLNWRHFTYIFYSLIFNSPWKENYDGLSDIERNKCWNLGMKLGVNGAIFELKKKIMEDKEFDQKLKTCDFSTYFLYENFYESHENFFAGIGLTKEDAYYYFYGLAGNKYRGSILNRKLLNLVGYEIYQGKVWNVNKKNG